MISISKVHIEGYKKFKCIDVAFNDDVSILVGDNESGKSTILDAIDLALNHSIKSFDLSLLSILLNKDNCNYFKITKTISDLPKIIIQIFFNGMDNLPKYASYFGANYINSSNKEKYGIEFIAELDKEYQLQLIDSIQKGIIPVEYYKLSTKTFGNSTYHPGVSEIAFCLINTSSDNAPSFNSYSKNMFKQLLSPDEQALIKSSFSEKINEAMNDTMKLIEDQNYPSFHRDVQKSSIENIISIYEDNIPLNLKGQGKEAVIKTEMMINNKRKSTIIAIEEPENHLSYSSIAKMLSLIKSKQGEKQIIITSHSSKVASGMGLNKIIMLSIDSSNTMMLKELKNNTADYFRAIPSDNLLYFVLAKKAILVEGPAELIYMNTFYKKMYPHSSLEKDGITCISVNGLSFKHFVEIGKLMKKKIVVITDNDNNIEKYKKFKKTLTEIYEDGMKFNVYSDPLPSNRTFEICLYENNKNSIESILKLKENALYEHDYSKENRYLGKMLNDKTGTALEISENNEFTNNLDIPQYIKEALEFIHNE